MGDNLHKLILLPNRTYQAQARSDIKKFALDIGLGGKRFSEMEIVVAELTSNLVKHAAKGGEILIKAITGDNPGMEIISIDHGPGMDNLAAMMEDGISTSKTLGQGLGAIKRLSDEFDAYSLKGWGTIVMARLYKTAPEAGRKLFNSGTVMVAKDGDVFCGDNYEIIQKGKTMQLIVCDGLGHGEAASQASGACIAASAAVAFQSPSDQLRYIHAAVRKTRGAVMYISQINFDRKTMHYCGIGNIAAKIVSPGGKNKGCYSYNGIVGHSVPGTLHSYNTEWEKADILIVHSDGLTGRWDLQSYPGILKHERIILAASLYKDHCRKTDDTLVSVIG